MKILEKIVLLLLRDEMEGKIIRYFFRKKYNIQVGLYSYGCFDSKRIPSNTIIGRYCSFARTATILNANHGIDFLTLHPYAYNKNFGMVKNERISRTKCIIEDDVWLGHNSTILPNVKRIGRGSIVAAGAVVTKDVPEYAIVAGSPAKVIKYRFNPEVAHKINSSKWWRLSKSELQWLIINKPDLIYNPTSSLTDEFFIQSEKK